LPLFFKNKKAFAYFLGFSGILALFSVAVLGIEGTKNFVQILTISSNGAWYGMKEDAMFNLIGILVRIFPSSNINIIHIVGWSAYLFAIIFISISWKRTETLKEEHLNTAIILSLFFAPHLHFHDLSLLIIPTLSILSSRKISATQENLALIPLGMSFLLIFTQPVSLLYYSLPYLLMLLLIIFTQRETKIHKNTNSFPSV